MFATAEVADLLQETHDMQQGKTIGKELAKCKGFMEVFIKTVILRKLLESPNVSEEKFVKEEQRKLSKFTLRRLLFSFI